MGFAGDIIKENKQVFADSFGRPLTVRNYEAGERDQHGDPERLESADSPYEVEALLEQQHSSESSTATGEQDTVEVNAQIPDDIPVYGGSDDRPFPSTITDETTGVTYTVESVWDESTGFRRCKLVGREQA